MRRERSLASLKIAWMWIAMERLPLLWKILPRLPCQPPMPALPPPPYAWGHAADTTLKSLSPLLSIGPTPTTPRSAEPHAQPTFDACALIGARALRGHQAAGSASLVMTCSTTSPSFGWSRGPTMQRWQPGASTTSSSLIISSSSDMISTGTREALSACRSSIMAERSEPASRNSHACYVMMIS